MNRNIYLAILIKIINQTLVCKHMYVKQNFQDINTILVHTIFIVSVLSSLFLYSYLKVGTRLM